MEKEDRPGTITTAQKIGYADAFHYLWGDPDSGYVSDVINLISREIILAEIRLPPGAGFRSSEVNKPIYDSDVCIYVLEGEYTVWLPETGLARIACEGEMLLLRGPKWHFGHNYGNVPTRVLETICPPSDPARFAEAQLLHQVKRFDPTNGRNETALELVRPENAIPAIVEGKCPMRLRVMANEPRVSLALVDLLPGLISEPLRFSHAASFYLEAGSAVIDNLDTHASERIDERDAYYLPAGTQWRLRNIESAPALGQIAVAGEIGPDLI